MKLASSHFIMFLLPFVVTPILSRLYAPESFGEWGVFSSTYTILNVVLFLCYEYAIVKVRESDYPNTCALCVAIAFAFIAVTSLVFIGGSLLGISFFEQFPCLLFFLSYLAISALNTVLSNVANRHDRYWVMSVGSMVTGGLQAAFRIVFGVSVVFYNGLIAGTVFAMVASTLFYMVCLYRYFNKDFFKQISFSGMRCIAIDNKKFPLYDAPSTLLAMAAFNLPVIILAAYFSKADIGCFSIIIQLLLLPMSFIGSAIGRVYYRQITDVKAAKDTLVQSSQLVLRLTSILAILPMLFLSVGGDHLLVLFLGDKWSMAGSIALCLSVWSLPTILTQPLLPVFRALNMQDMMLKYEGLYFLMGVGVLSISCAFGLSLCLCVLLFALACCVAKLLLFASLVKVSDVKLRKAFQPPLLAVYILTLTILSYRLYDIIF